MNDAVHTPCESMNTTTPQTVKRYFNTIACRYDLLNSLLSFGLHHLWKRTAIALAGLMPGDRVLDVCGGTADLAIRAARSVGGAGRVAVYDFSSKMLSVGKTKAAAAVLSHPVCFVCGDAGQIAAKDALFEVVLIGFGLRNLADREKGLREMLRVLKPGGRLICLEFSRPVNPWFRVIYDLYSLYGIPFIGKAVGGSREAYTYLPDSIRSFPSPEQLSLIFNKAGFTEVRYTRLTNGIAAIHVGIKKA
ncbi:MAG: bifunctional demethylmenaquinone methyltransferase/2-methoxy-6-polyprenyl-1,4-benzoquinol methylase UbiE [Pseudomonadota bacterium]